MQPWLVLNSQSPASASRMLGFHTQLLHYRPRGSSAHDPQGWAGPDQNSYPLPALLQFSLYTQIPPKAEQTLTSHSHEIGFWFYLQLYLIIEGFCGWEQYIKFWWNLIILNICSLKINCEAIAFSDCVQLWPSCCLFQGHCLSCTVHALWLSFSCSLRSSLFAITRSQQHQSWLKKDGFPDSPAGVVWRSRPL